MRRRNLLGSLASVLAVASCRPAPVSTAVPNLSLESDPSAIAGRYPRVDGSTSTHPLQMLIACKILNARCAWSPAPMAHPLGSSEKRILPEDLAARIGPAGAILTSLVHSGTHTSYINLINGQTDFLLVARPPSSDELLTARSAGVKLNVTAVALDAFVFLVNAGNPISSISIAQLRGMYGGKTTDWSEVGGIGGRIKAYQRDRNSGSRELMEALVMKGARMIDAPNMMIETMSGPINAVGSDPQGIGYSVYYYTTAMLPDSKVKMIGIDGTKPTSENIRNRSYPLIAEVYAVRRAEMPPDSSAVMLCDWLLSRDGQAVVVESGYVPIR